MRIDTLTTQFRSALLAPPASAARALLARSGVQSPTLQRALNEALDRSATVRGGDGHVQMGRELGGLLNQAEKEAHKAGDRYIASEMFLLALADDKGATGQLLR